MKQITDKRFIIGIKNFKSLYERETGYKLPNYNVKIIDIYQSHADCDFSTDNYFIKMSKIHYHMGKEHLKSIMYHELTHLYHLTQICKSEKIKKDISSFSELHASYIEAKCKFGLFVNEQVSLNDMTINETGEPITVENALKELLSFALEEIDKAKSLKAMEYCLGHIKCVEDYCTNFNKEEYLKPLIEKFGGGINTLYEVLQAPLDYIIENIAKCDIAMLGVIENIV